MFFRRNNVWLAATMLVYSLLWGVAGRALSVRAAVQKYWELSPYRVELHIAVNDSLFPNPSFGENLASELQQQIRATIYPLWTTNISVATGDERQLFFTLLNRADEPKQDLFDTSEWATGCDKQIFLSVELTRLGMMLRCRELDCTTRRWGARHERLAVQSSMLTSNCFQIACEAFSPLATVRSIADEDSEVLLKFRGSDLPRQTDLDFLKVVGEPYQPLRVRTNSAGEIKTDSISDINWTYLSLDRQAEDGWRAKVHTGTRRPFGVRRRGRVEHFALAMRRPEGKSRIRFYARHDSSQGLAGYEVFQRDPEASKSEPLGLTDTLGSVEVEPSESRVTLLFLRSEGQLLAKVPVVPGAKALVEVPIADDTARLRAQAALTSLTEQLIDTVAQRNILIARVRDRIKSNEIDAAQELFTELDSLPGRAQFDQEIKSVEQRRLHQSTDPKVQVRIEKLFADTRKLLGRFLSTKPISEVQNELTAARRGNAS